MRVLRRFAYGANNSDINGEKILFDLYTTDDLADLLGEFTPQAVTTTTIDGKDVQVWSSQPLNWDCKWDDDGVALEYDKFCLIGFRSGAFVVFSQRPSAHFFPLCSTLVQSPPYGYPLYTQTLYRSRAITWRPDHI